MGKVAMNAGIYDLTHHGHVNLFNRMREMADRIVAVVHDDKSCYQIKGKIPVQNLKQRVNNLKIIGLVDEIYIVTDPDPAEMFSMVHQKYGNQLVYVRGDDLTENFPGQYKLTELGIPIHFVPYTKNVSSTSIRDSL